MSIRWFLVAGVLLWLAYEYASPLWGDLWEQYATHIKFAGGVLVVLGLLYCCPSSRSPRATRRAPWSASTPSTTGCTPLPAAAPGLGAGAASA